MCGIAGFVESPSVHAPFAGRRAARARRPPCAAPSAIAVPTTKGRGPRRRRRRSACGGSASSTSPAATSRFTTRTARSGSSSTARSTTSASCGASSKRPAIASIRRPTPRSSSTRTSSGARPRSRRLRGMFGLAIWDARHADAAARARPHRHQAAALRGVGRAAVFRLGDQVDPVRARTCRASSTSTRSITICRSSTRRATDRSSRASASCRPGTCSTWRDGRHQSGTLLGVAGRRAVRGLRSRTPSPSSAASWPTPSDRISSATCRSAPSSPAASTRAWSSA